MVDLGNGRGWLNPGPAASIHRIDREIGHPLQITEAGRSWEQQKAHWDTYQRNGYPIALHPDAPSVHQLGAAIDTDERITAVLNDHGWVHTVYRNGVLVEPWHYEYAATRDKHINDVAPAALSEEDDMDCMILINGKIYALAPGFIKHCDSVAQVREAKARGVAQHDYTGADRLNQWVRALDFYGVPRDVLDKSGLVRNPESGRHENFALWTWERENKALLTQLLKKA